MKKAIPEKSKQPLPDRIHFGTQYYRVVPPPEEWDDDLRHMKDIGLDFAKIESVWSLVEPKEGVFDWRDLDGLMNKAADNGLKVMMTLPFESFPQWLFRKYKPHIIDIDRKPGRIIRYNGGVARDSFCWDYPGVSAAVERYVSTIVERYKSHPALLCWDLFQEIDIKFCACEHTTALYQEWLAGKFKDIDTLNRTFGGEVYGSFKEIEPPFTLAFEGQSSSYYARFRDELLGGRIKWLVDTAKKIDTAHPAIVHTHSGGFCNYYSSSWDDWLAYRHVDFYGMSFHEAVRNYPPDNLCNFVKSVAHLELTRSVSREKNYFWVAELSAGTACERPSHKRLNEGDLTFNLWTAIAHGAKGISLWAFKPERYFTLETPSGWGLVNLDGEETYRTREFRRFEKSIGEHSDLFFKAERPSPEIGLLYSSDSHKNSFITSPYASTRLFNYENAFWGAVSMLWLNNIQFDIIKGREELHAYKVIYCPMPWMLEKSLFDALEEFAKNGGTVIADGGLSRYTENCWLSTDVPGYGLSGRLGVREYELEMSDKVLIKTAAGDVYGAQELASIDPGTNKVLGTFEDGRAAIVECKYGNGKFILCASSISSYFMSETGPDYVERVRKLFGFIPLLEVKPLGRVTARIQRSGNSHILYLFNHFREKVEAEFRLGEDFRYSGYSVVTGEEIVAMSDNAFSVSIDTRKPVVILFHSILPISEGDDL